MNHEDFSAVARAASRTVTDLDHSGALAAAQEMAKAMAFVDTVDHSGALAAAQEMAKAMAFVDTVDHSGALAAAQEMAKAMAFVDTVDHSGALAAAQEMTKSAAFLDGLADSVIWSSALAGLAQEIVESNDLAGVGLVDGDATARFPVGDDATLEVVADPVPSDAAAMAVLLVVLCGLTAWAVLDAAGVAVASGAEDAAATIGMGLSLVRGVTNDHPAVGGVLDLATLASIVWCVFVWVQKQTQK
ncbi:MAG: hypothetical protein JWM89_3430 [Acidimicrobiales bacterium]|nr:hypothetical protein [Acidimicrobiales bacterium]